MEILRVPSYQIQAEISVSSPSTSYDYTVTDMADNSVSNGTLTSSIDSKITIDFSDKYDSSYLVNVDGTDHYIDVVRPYVDPTTKAETASEINDYAKYEIIARAIIDSVVREGFYYKKHTIQTTGLGADYIPLWVNAHRVLKLYENNVLMYDFDNAENYSTSYKVTTDKTAVIEDYEDMINRLESSALMIPSAGSDIFDIKYTYKGFPKTFDYTIVLEVGYPNIPSDIVRATELLVDDIACGRLDYAQRYMKSYQTDQFKIGFDDRVFEGTGNLVVDKILSKYAKSITNPGVL